MQLHVVVVVVVVVVYSCILVLLLLLLQDGAGTLHQSYEKTARDTDLHHQAVAGFVGDGLVLVCANHSDRLDQLRRTKLVVRPDLERSARSRSMQR